MADLNGALVQDLGVQQLHAVIGGSMGGMQSMQFAIRQDCLSLAHYLQLANLMTVPHKLLHSMAPPVNKLLQCSARAIE